MPMPPTQIPANWIELLGRKVVKELRRKFMYFRESPEHFHIVVNHDTAKKFDVYGMKRDYFRLACQVSC